MSLSDDLPVRKSGNQRVIPLRIPVSGTSGALVANGDLRSMAAPSVRAGGLTLRLNLIWTLIGNLGYAACQWGMLIVLAKVGSPELVGQFSLALAVTAPIVLLSNLNLRAVQCTDARDEHTFQTYLGLRLMLTLLAMFVIAGVALAGYDGGTVWVILLIGGAKGVESLSDIFYGLQQRHEQMDRIAISQLARGALSLAALGLGVWITGNVVWGALGLAAAWTLVLATYDLPCSIRALRDAYSADRARLRPDLNVTSILRLAWVALPLGVVQMLLSLNVNIPRYFIEANLGHRELGIFAALQYVLVLGNTVVFALGQAMSPRLAKLYADGRPREFAILVLRVVVMCILGGLAAAILILLLGKPALSLLYTPDYAQHVEVFLVLMVSTIVGCIGSILGFGATAARKFSVQVPLFLATTIVTVVSCAFLVPSFGLLGSAWAVLIAAGFSVCGIAVVLYRALAKCGAVEAHAN